MFNIKPSCNVFEEMFVFRLAHGVRETGKQVRKKPYVIHV
jgi:hypothetical protein